MSSTYFINPVDSAARRVGLWLEDPQKSPTGLQAKLEGGRKLHNLWDGVSAR